MLAWFGVLVSFLVVVPAFQGPDELQHVDRVLSGSVAGFPEWDEAKVSQDVLEGYRIMRGSSEPGVFSADEAPARPQPGMSELAGGRDSAVPNQLASHPPMYYALMAGARTFLTGLLPRSFWQFDREVILLRFLNILLLLPLPLLLARTARHLRLPDPAPWVAAVFPLCVPQLAFMGSVVNNDNLLILAGCLTLMFAAAVLTEGVRWVPCLLMAAAAAVGMQTKLFGVLIGAFAALVVLVAPSPRRSRLPVVAAVGAILAAGSWTYLRNVARYGHPYPTLLPSLPTTDGSFVFDAREYLWALVTKSAASFWGHFGWLWLPLPFVWIGLLSLATAGCIVVTLLRPPAPWIRFMLLPLALLVLAFVGTSLQLHLGSGIFPAMQGRYLFPAITSVALAVASALARIWPRRAVTVVCVTAGVGWLLSMGVLLNGYWAGSGLERARSLAAWSSFSTWWLMLLGCAGVLVLGGLVTAWALLRRSVRAPVPAVPS